MIVVKNYQIRKMVLMCSGIVIMAISTALFCESSLGTDPYTCLNLGISRITGVPFGITQLCVSGIFLLISVSFGKHLLGIGSLLYTLSMGFLTDLFRFCISSVFSYSTLEDRAALLLFGILFLGIGASFFFTANCGVSSYDALGFILTQKTHIGYRWCHISTDVICAVIGFLLGAPIGIGTLIAAIFMGPIVQFFNKRIAVPFLNPRTRF